MQYLCICQQPDRSDHLLGVPYGLSYSGRGGGGERWWGREVAHMGENKAQKWGVQMFEDTEFSIVLLFYEVLGILKTLGSMICSYFRLSIFRVQTAQGWWGTNQNTFTIIYFRIFYCGVTMTGAIRQYPVTAKSFRWQL